MSDVTSWEEQVDLDNGKKIFVFLLGEEDIGIFKTEQLTHYYLQNNSETTVDL